MNLTALCAAALNGQKWLELFQSKTYEKAFRDYQAQFGPAYAEALLETGEDEAALRALAGELLDGLRNAWRQERFWNRSGAKMDSRQVLVNYLSPMLLELSVPGSHAFCGILRDEWAARWPKEHYRIGSWQRIDSGFRNTVLGFEIRGKQPEEQEDL